MNRRDFLTLAGGGAFGGYTLVVRADETMAGPPTHEQWSESFRALVPPGGDAVPAAAEPNMAVVELRCDVVVTGGGMAGVCAAVAAARQGARVVLVQDRSGLGGNSSSEVKMHIVGANCHGGRPGWREGGLIEEFRLDDAVGNPHRSFALWDLLLYEKVRSEANITLLLDSTVYRAAMRDGRIQHVQARCDKTEIIYRIEGKLYVDCTGDSRLALEAGAEMRWGREARNEFNESLAPEKPDRQTLGSSILFTARDYGRPIQFKAPVWARPVRKEQLRFRPVSSWEYGYWWIEWGGQLNTIRDNERIRFELLSIVLGVWDYIKNSGSHPDSANWGMDWIGMVPGKRESRRIVGDHLLTQNDLMGSVHFEDAVAIGGWPLDDHPPSGFDEWEKRPATQVRPDEVYSIPLRSLYSRNIANLMMAGRNISATHAAFASTRVMATCAVVGQAAGTAAALAAQQGLSPRQLCQDVKRLRELQQVLLRNDQTIKDVKNEDPGDLARSARVTASAEHDLSRAAHVVNGLVRDRAGEWSNRWGARLEGEPVWLELGWERPQRLRELQCTFDTGFHRELTLSASDSASARVIRAAQPETVRDYEVSYVPGGGGERVRLVKVQGNYQRVGRHRFEPIEAKSIRLTVLATNGDAIARVYEVRAYG